MILDSAFLIQQLLVCKSFKVKLIFLEKLHKTINSLSIIYYYKNLKKNLWVYKILLLFLIKQVEIYHNG